MAYRKMQALLVTILFVLPAIGCSRDTGEPIRDGILLPTPPTVAVIEAEPEAVATSEATLVPAPTVTSLPALILPTDEPEAGDGVTSTPEATATPARYRVAFVEDDDILNVRSGAGIENEVVGVLEPDTTGIEVGSARREVAGSTWTPIRAGALEGWVNSRYLTQQVDPDQFCNDAAGWALLEEFMDEVATGSLDRSVDADRGLRVRLSWWNPEVVLRDEALTKALERETEYEWGVEDGSGRPVTGSVREVVYPLLRENLADASEIGCNEILHGGTAGSVILPASYEGINYFSVYRPADSDGIEMDWDTWVIGVERWAGSTFISFLVHYDWEI